MLFLDNFGHFQLLIFLKLDSIPPFSLLNQLGSSPGQQFQLTVVNQIGDGRDRKSRNREKIGLTKIEPQAPLLVVPIHPFLSWSDQTSFSRTLSTAYYQISWLFIRRCKISKIDGRTEMVTQDPPPQRGGSKNRIFTKF